MSATTASVTPPETLDRLAPAGVDVYRTDHAGSILVETDGESATVNGDPVVNAGPANRSAHPNRRLQAQGVLVLICGQRDANVLALT